MHTGCRKPASKHRNHFFGADHDRHRTRQAGILINKKHQHFRCQASRRYHPSNRPRSLCLDRCLGRRPGGRANMRLRAAQIPRYRDVLNRHLVFKLLIGSRFEREIRQRCRGQSTLAGANANRMVEFDDEDLWGKGRTSANLSVSFFFFLQLGP